MAQVILHPREGRSPKDYALMYVGLGWKVFPVWGTVPSSGDGTGRICACIRGEACDRPGKHPIAELVPSGVSDATDSRAKVEAWWGARPEASIGIATGSVSGLTVVDADASGGKPGLINLTRLCAAHGGVPATFVVETGGGGLHLYFKYNAALRTGVNVLDEAIDVRSDGGYVIAPPSTHVRGVYKWREDRAELKDLPGWMVTAPQEAQARGARRRGRPRTREAMPLEQVEAMLNAIDPDDRDRWLKVGVILGRAFVGTASEGEAWALYEAWAARSSKFDENRSANLDRMREQFAEYSQEAPRAGQQAIGLGSLFQWAKEGGWSPFGDRAVIRYAPGDEAKMCAELVAALVSDEERNRFFNIMGEVRDVLICTLPQLRAIFTSVTSGQDLPEKLLVRKATVDGLRSALSEAAVITGVGAEGQPVSKPIPEALASMILKDHSNDFPPLAGICEWPMVMNGEVIMRPRGYDRATGMFFDIRSDLRIEEIAPERAWAWLCEEMLVDFPFESELHRARALGMMLAMQQRPLMKTCPAFAVTAPQPGTGKSTLVEAAALAVHGSSMFSHAFSSDEEELRKALHALMIAKAPAVMFDNVGRGRAIHSDHLSKMITSEAATDRVLGSSETRTEINTLLITFTGNNISFTRDMASRVVTIRLNAHSANPIGRAFRHPDIKHWSSSNRSKVLSALVAIARTAFTGPALDGRASRFEDYDALIVRAVKNVTGVDIRTADEESDAGVDEEETAETREALATLYSWQQHMRSTNGERWRVTELTAAIEGRAFSEQQTAALKRWAGGTRDFDANPTRALGYVLRSVRDGHNFHPFVVTARSTHLGQLWLIKNLAPGSTSDATNQGTF